MSVFVEIEVIKVPEGEAPEEIKSAWVGIKMQAIPLESVPRAHGVVTHRDVPDPGPSYAVRCGHAVNALRCAGKISAADWWVKHVLSFDALVFRAEECRELTTA